MRIKKFLVAAALVLTSAAGLAVTDAPSADAAGSSFCNRSTCVLSGNASTSRYFFAMPRATPVNMVCWTTGQHFQGTAKWFKVTSRYGTGFMNANEVSNQRTVGRC